jgi:hypothetical protein
MLHQIISLPEISHFKSLHKDVLFTIANIGNRIIYTLVMVNMNFIKQAEVNVSIIK